MYNQERVHQTGTNFIRQFVGTSKGESARMRTDSTIFVHSHVFARLLASAASACNRADYRTFNVMLLKSHILLHALH